MADASPIEWTDATWNPVRGCSRVSAGCANCYAERVAMRQSNPGGGYEGLVHQTSQGPKWTGVIRTVPQLLDQPLRWRRPRRIFVNSMSDLFHQDVPDEFITRVWQVMGRAQQHTFQILTKRPARMLAWLQKWTDLSGEDMHDFKNARGPAAVRAAHPSGRGRLFAEVLEAMGQPPAGCAYPSFDWAEGLMRWPDVLPNVWLGVSVEDQAAADERIPLLLQTLAAVRWISAEPLLGRIDLSPWWKVDTSRPSLIDGAMDWVVAGGESGPKARPSHPDWYRSLRDQCQVTSVPFFFKQWGNWKPVGPLYCDEDTVEHLAALDTDPDEWHRELWVTRTGSVWPPRDGQAPVGTWAIRRVPKAVAGRELDGRTWDEFPRS